MVTRNGKRFPSGGWEARMSRRILIAVGVTLAEFDDSAAPWTHRACVDRGGNTAVPTRA